LCNTRRFDHDVVDAAALVQLLDRVQQRTLERAAQTAGGKLDHIDVAPFDNRTIDADLAKLVDDYRQSLLLRAFGQDMTYQCGLTGAEKTEQQVDSHYCAPAAAEASALTGLENVMASTNTS
jgi:hypothetical protein